MANEPMQLIPVPSGLLSRFLLTQEVAPEASRDTCGVDPVFKPAEAKISYGMRV